MTAKLFTPLDIGPITLPNRIAVAPMCQYSAREGNANDWHFQHLVRLALAGPGLLVIEATAVSEQGRITHGCLGLYSDANEAALARVVQACRALGHAHLGIQLAHAGRKASAQTPWEGGKPLPAGDGAWQAVAPSAIPFGDGWHTPAALDQAGLDRVRASFVQAALRAARLGLDLAELHAAHGYLLHEFLSPLSNRREDRYGGSLENRMRFPLEVFDAVREAWPRDRALGARITGTDWVEGGVTPAEAVIFARALKARGCDYVCVTSAGVVGTATIPVAPGYQVPFAARVRAETGIVTRAVGMIAAPAQAEEIVASGQADQVALARAFLDDPHWVWHAAERLGVRVSYPPQYVRARSDLWPGAALLRPADGARAT